MISSYCNWGECASVELNRAGRVVVSSTVTGFEVSFTEPEWEAFVQGVKAGEFDLDRLRAADVKPGRAKFSQVDSYRSDRSAMAIRNHLDADHDAARRRRMTTDYGMPIQVGDHGHLYTNGDTWLAADGAGWLPGIYADESAARLALQVVQTHYDELAKAVHHTARGTGDDYRPVTVQDLEALTKETP